MEGGDQYLRNRFRLEVALQARRAEIDLFWRRSVFFWGFIAAAGAGAAWAYADHARMAIAFSCFGLVCSCAWTLANRGSRFWQVTWERKVHESEDAVIGPLFKTLATPPLDEKLWWRGKRYALGRLTIALSDYVVFLWATALLYQLVRTLQLCSLVSFRHWGILALVVASVIYVLLMRYKTRQHGDTLVGR